MILKVYDTAFSGPDPDGWLTDCINAPEDIRWENADHVLWMREYLRDMQAIISRGLMLAEQNAALAASPAGPSAYIPAAQDSLELFRALDSARNDYESLRNILTSFSPVKLSSAKASAGEDASLRESFKNTRASIKKLRESLLSDYLRYDAETLLESQRNSIPVLAELVRLVRRFREMFS